MTSTVRISVANGNRPNPNALLTPQMMDLPLEALPKTQATSFATVAAKKAITPLNVTSGMQSHETNGMSIVPCNISKNLKQMILLAMTTLPLMEAPPIMTPLAPLLVAIAGVGHQADQADPEAKHPDEVPIPANAELVGLLPDLDTCNWATKDSVAPQMKLPATQLCQLKLQTSKLRNNLTNLRDNFFSTLVPPSVAPSLTQTWLTTFELLAPHFT